MSTIETSETSSAAAEEAKAAATNLPIVTKPGRVPIKSWAGELDPRTLEQATNVSNLPFAIDHVALMPDGHAAFGMPIGAVLFADKAVVPYAIGVDIGCGVAFVETDLTVRRDRPDSCVIRGSISARARRCDAHITTCLGRGKAIPRRTLPGCDGVSRAMSAETTAGAVPRVPPWYPIAADRAG